MAVLWNHGSGWDDTDLYAEARARGLIPPAPTEPNFGASRRGIPAAPAGLTRHRRVGGSRRPGSFFITAYQTVESDDPGRPRRAIAFDDDAQDFLDNQEMRKVFTDVTAATGKRFDIIGMDACLMAMVETAVQIRGCADYFCASQELEPGDGWPYHTLLAELAARPEMDAREFSGRIVRDFTAAYPAYEVVTQSACELAGIDRVATATDALGAALVHALAAGGDPSIYSALHGARSGAQGFDHPDYIDLDHFCELLATAAPSTANETREVRDALRACVFENSAPNLKVGNARGLSIYFPHGRTNDLYRNLEFGRGDWTRFLDAY